MLFNVARLAGRVVPEGNLLRLKDQDRSTWDHALIGLAMHHLAKAAGGDEISEYHLQAGIAACHCTAPDYAATDWPRIVAHYDQWVAMNHSPIVALNRAVAVAQVHGPKAGVTEVGKIKNRTALDGYYLTYAVLGDFEEQLEHHAIAAAHFRRAIELTSLKSEQIFLKKRLAECRGRMGKGSEKGKVKSEKR
jgi:RNA polymerase sigma-70 factor (ECF subfamily)